MTSSLFLFAQGLGDGFRKFSQGTASAGDYLLMFGTLALLIAAAAAAYFWDRRRETTVREESTPESLFRELCNEHALSPSERELLQRVIGTGTDRLEQPAFVFVDRNILAGWGMRSGDAVAAEMLERKLFGG